MLVRGREAPPACASESRRPWSRRNSRAGAECGPTSWFENPGRADRPLVCRIRALGAVEQHHGIVGGDDAFFGIDQRERLGELAGSVHRKQDGLVVDHAVYSRLVAFINIGEPARRARGQRLRFEKIRQPWILQVVFGERVRIFRERRGEADGGRQPGVARSWIGHPESELARLGGIRDVLPGGLLSIPAKRASFRSFQTQQNRRQHGLFLRHYAALEVAVHREILAVRDPKSVILFAGGDAIDRVERAGVSELEIQTGSVANVGLEQRLNVPEFRPGEKSECFSWRSILGFANAGPKDERRDPDHQPRDQARRGASHGGSLHNCTGPEGAADASEIALTAVSSRRMRASPSASIPFSIVILVPIVSMLFDRNSSILSSAAKTVSKDALRV